MLAWVKSRSRREEAECLIHILLLQARAGILTVASFLSITDSSPKTDAVVRVLERLHFGLQK